MRRMQQRRWQRETRHAQASARALAHKSRVYRSVPCILNEQLDASTRCFLEHVQCDDAMKVIIALKTMQRTGGPRTSHTSRLGLHVDTQICRQ